MSKQTASAATAFTPVRMPRKLRSSPHLNKRTLAFGLFLLLTLRFREHFSESERVGDKLQAWCGIVLAAIYFPGFHRDVNNDILWKRGFTEWTHFDELTTDGVTREPVRTPRRLYKLNYEVLRNQAKLARSQGVRVFVFYTYWFEHGRTALFKPIRDLLPDRRLGTTFCVSWANEPWTARWDGMDGNRTLIFQKYGTTFDWAMHMEHLLPVFRHPDYLRIDSKPVMFIYNLAHVVRAGAEDVVRGDCAKFTQQIFGPGGAPAAQLYKKWYPDLNEIALEDLFQYHKLRGKVEGRDWPVLACTESKIVELKRTRAEATLVNNSTLLERMMTFFDAYARECGFGGIHIVGTISPFVSAQDFDGMAANSPIQSAVQFAPFAYSDVLSRASQECGCATSTFSFHANEELDPGCPPDCACFLGRLQAAGVHRNKIFMPTSAANHGRRFFRGAFFSWSNFPRHAHDKIATSFCKKPNAHAFSLFVQDALEAAVQDRCLATVDGENSAHSLVLVNAWNEWGEQAAIEPIEQDGHSALNAIRSAVQAVESKIRFEVTV